ncbi:MAG: hypothetical protein AABY32_01800 [Nanoarchaeota archaeon]
MKRNLVYRRVYHLVGGIKMSGLHDKLKYSDDHKFTHEIMGDCSNIYGIIGSLYGDVSCLNGDVTGICGDGSHYFGDLDSCGISIEEREMGVDIGELVE